MRTNDCPCDDDVRYFQLVEPVGEWLEAIHPQQVDDPFLLLLRPLEGNVGMHFGHDLHRF